MKKKLEVLKNYELTKSQTLQIKGGFMGDCVSDCVSEYKKIDKTIEKKWIEATCRAMCAIQ